MPWAFEHSPAEPTRAADAYLRELTKSDLIVVIVSNSHSESVQSELDLADLRGKPILAFVRRIGETEVTASRLSALRWLRNRVKYQYFDGTEDLRRHVIDAVASELVRGYKRYRLGHVDYSTLLASVPSPPSLIVRDAESRDFPAIESALLELKDLYPEIGLWISKVMKEATGPGSQIRLADLAGEMAGLAISRDKESGVRKFSTIYIRPGFRGDAVGPHLVHHEVRRAARDGIRKAYVTFAHELSPSLSPILRRYGFVTEGIGAGRYRAGEAEWVMAKTFCYGALGCGDLGGFVEDHLAREFGAEVVQRRDGAVRLHLPHQVFGLPLADSVWIAYSSSSRPEEEYQEWSAQFRDQSWMFCSLYGRPADQQHWSNSLDNWIDGEDLRARYHPLDVSAPEQEAMLCSIRPGYADAIIPRVERPPLFAPDRLQIRPDNVYYRTPDRYQTLRRGSDLLFYVTSPERSLRGSSRIQSSRVDAPEACLSLFGSMGVFDFGDLERIASKHGGQVLSLAFDWYTQHAKNLTSHDIKKIVPRFNPASAVVLSHEESKTLRACSA